MLTPAYSPPETFRHGPPTAAVDVYGLSATLYAMLCGRPPRFQHELNPSILALLELFEQPIPDLPGIPPQLMDVLRLGMANDPLARPTAGQLRDLLLELPLDRGASPDAPWSTAPNPTGRRSPKSRPTPTSSATGISSVGSAPTEA